MTFRTLMKQRAQGTPGAVAPASLVCSKLRKNAHGQSTGTTEHTPAFPAQWFTAYTRSPRSAGLSSLRRLSGSSPAGLIPASGDQDHAISPSASAALVSRYLHVHRIPLPTSVTIAKRPSCGNGTPPDNHIFPINGSGIFLSAGLDMASGLF